MEGVCHQLGGALHLDISWYIKSWCHWECSKGKNLFRQFGNWLTASYIRKKPIRGRQTYSTTALTLGVTPSGSLTNERYRENPNILQKELGRKTARSDSEVQRALSTAPPRPMLTQWDHSHRGPAHMAYLWGVEPHSTWRIFSGLP